MRPIVTLLLILASCSVLPALATEQPKTADEIVKHVENLLWGTTMVSKWSMEIVTPDWQRTLEIESWSEGTEKSFVRILQPAKDRGVSFLKIGSQMWNYLPKIDRVVRIPPSMMMSSWMGSDFTNDDMARESSISKDYTAGLADEQSSSSHDLYRLILTPRPTASVVWGKVEFDIRKADYMPVTALYYDEDAILVREITYEQYTLIDQRLIPTKTILTPKTTDKQGQRTILMLLSAEFDRKLDQEIFTERNLKRGIQ